MQIIIDISEDQYSLIMQSHRSGVERFVEKEAMMYAIKNGTPLSKGHGRLIDADKLTTDMFYFMTDKNKTHTAKMVMSIAKGLVDLQETVIKTDSVESEETVDALIELRIM